MTESSGKAGIHRGGSCGRLGVFGRPPEKKRNKKTTIVLPNMTLTAKRINSTNARVFGARKL